MEYQKFLDRYQTEFGENFSTLIETFPQFQISAQGAYNRIHRQIEEFIKSKNSAYDFDDIKKWQKEAVLDAEIYQAFYIFHNVDFSILSGYDSTSGALIDKKTIADRELCNDVVRILKNARLLYRVYGVPQ